MNSRTIVLLAAVAILSLTAGSANAALIFVGQWEVDDGPHWPTNPPVYSGQEAAALLFGGTPSDYSISTIDNNPANVNNMAWYSIWGIPSGTQGAENLHIDLGGPGYNNPGGNNTAWSAYVNDNAIGANFTNFAFRNDAAANVPEPATIAIWGIGAAGFGLAMRRRRRAA